MKLEKEIMKKLFKTTLVAAAVTAATATTGYAATLAVGAGSTISQEGAASEASITLPDVTITLGDEYAVNDRLVLTVGGATVKSQAGATLVDADSEIQFGKLASTSDNTVIFRITSIGLDTNGDTLPTTGNTLTLSGITLETASVVDGGNVTVSYSGQLSDGTVIESTTAADAITVKSQFGGSVTAQLDGVIDVNADRQLFTGGASSDSLTVTPTEVTGLSLAASATTITHTLFGDFSYVDLDGDGDADVSFSASTSGDDTASAVTIAADYMSASFSQGVVGTMDSATLTVSAPGQAAGNPTMDKQDFMVTTTTSYTDNQGTAGNKVVVNDADAGEWTLNGAQVFVPYMPVGFAGVFSRVVLANDGVQDGEIEVEAFDEDGNTYGPVALGQVLEGGSNLTITGGAVAFALGISGSAKLTVTLTINAPANDVTSTGFTSSSAGRQLLETE